jgi:hypothetical protein
LIDPTTATFWPFLKPSSSEFIQPCLNQSRFNLSLAEHRSMTSFLNWFTPPAAPPAAEFEVVTGLDAFISLEDLVPGGHWQELLADAWGVPYSVAAKMTVSTEERQHRTEVSSGGTKGRAPDLRGALYGTAS